MSKTVTQEINEFIDAIKTYDQADLMASTGRVVREGVEALGRVMAIDDDPAVLQEFTDAVKDAIYKFVGEALTGKPVIRGVVQGAVPMVVPAIVAEASKRLDNVDGLIDEKVLPFFKWMESFGHDGRVAFGG